MSVYFKVGRSANSKCQYNSNDLAKILLQSNQKSNELSMNRTCEQSVTTDERRTFTKVLGADKDKVHGDLTLGNTGGNKNKDAMFHWTRLNVIVILMWPLSRLLHLLCF